MMMLICFPAMLPFRDAMPDAAITSRYRYFVIAARFFITPAAATRATCYAAIAFYHTPFHVLLMMLRCRFSCAMPLRASAQRRARARMYALRAHTRRCCAASAIDVAASHSPHMLLQPAAAAAREFLMRALPAIARSRWMTRVMQRNYADAHARIRALPLILCALIALPRCVAPCCACARFAMPFLRRYLRRLRLRRFSDG